MKLKDLFSGGRLALIAALLIWGCSTAERTTPAQVSTEENNSPLTVDLNASDFTPMPFVSRSYGNGDWQATLSMNVTHEPIQSLRTQIAEHLGYDALKYLTAWEPAGEAHITTITPVEYQECMWSERRQLQILNMEAIEDLAREHAIQNSDLEVLGIGSGSKKFEERDRTDETFFVIVKSRNLLTIRNAIYLAYVQNGGDPTCWDPDVFYPHITVGFTFKDIHYPDVKKDVKESLDNRFTLKATAAASAQCKSVAVNAAIDAVNMANQNEFFQSGFIDSHQSTNTGETYRVILSNSTDHPDGEQAFEITLNPYDNCNLVSLVDDYSGKKIPNPYE